MAVRLENRSFLLRMPERKDHATFLWDTACSLSLSHSFSLSDSLLIPFPSSSHEHSDRKNAGNIQGRDVLLQENNQHVVTRMTKMTVATVR